MESEDILTCDICGSNDFTRPADYPDAYPMIAKVFGDRVILCMRCGAVRYPEEVGGRLPKEKIN